MSEQIAKVVVGSIETNCYLLYSDTKEAVVIDPGGDFSLIEKFVAENGLKPAAIVNTHGHYDHVLANGEVQQKYDIPVYYPEKDRYLMDVQNNIYEVPGFKVDHYYNSGDELELAGFKIKVISTPGHSEGSSCLQTGEYLFSGDTMFAEGGYGRTDLWGGSDEQMMDSLKQLFAFQDNIKVYPGHGFGTTIGEERRYYEW